jgi:hypothetical protein
MAFHDFLESQRNPAPQREPQYEVEERDNYEEKTPQRERQSNREGFDDEDSKVLDEVDFYKQRLYKKIDSCFIRYGLAGLKKIDEGIADSLARYIDSLKGGTNYEDRIANRYGQNYRRPPERVRYRDDELNEGDEDLTRRPEPKPAPKPFKKPVKIEGSNPNPLPRRAGEPNLQAGVYNPELLNAILTDVIPPTEIHPVEIHSSIPVPQKQQQPAQQKVDFAPLPEDMQEQEQPQEQTYEQTVETYQAPQQAESSNFDIADVMLAGAGNTDVSLIVPPTIEEPTAENFVSDTDLDAPIVESETQTPINMPAPKRRKKK